MPRRNYPPARHRRGWRSTAQTGKGGKRMSSWHRATDSDVALIGRRQQDTFPTLGTSADPTTAAPTRVLSGKHQPKRAAGEAL
jgi:hypothetical protein